MKFQLTNSSSLSDCLATMADGTPFALFDAAIVCKIKLHKNIFFENL